MTFERSDICANDICAKWAREREREREREKREERERERKMDLLATYPDLT